MTINVKDIQFNYKRRHIKEEEKNIQNEGTRVAFGLKLK